MEKLRGHLQRERMPNDLSTLFNEMLSKLDTSEIADIEQSAATLRAAINTLSEIR